MKKKADKAEGSFPDDYLTYYYIFQISEIVQAAKLQKERKSEVMSQRFYADEARNNEEIDKFKKLFGDFENVSERIINKENINTLKQYKQMFGILNIINSDIDELVERNLFLRTQSLLKRNRPVRKKLLTYRCITYLTDHQKCIDITNRYSYITFFVLWIIANIAIFFILLLHVKVLFVIVTWLICVVGINAFFIYFIAKYGSSLRHLDRVYRTRYKYLPKQKSYMNLKTIFDILRIVISKV